jgi:hypothetical protein
VEITWDLIRGDLKAGVSYEISLDAVLRQSGDLHFTAGEDGIAVAGESSIHLAPAACERFRRGDVDGDGAASITDPVVLLTHLFLGGPAPGCPDASDADDSGVPRPLGLDLDPQLAVPRRRRAPGSGAGGVRPRSDGRAAASRTLRVRPGEVLRRTLNNSSAQADFLTRIPGEWNAPFAPPRVRDPSSVECGLHRRFPR